MRLARALGVLAGALVLTGTLAERSSVTTEPPAIASNEGAAALPGPTTSPDPPSVFEIDDGEAEAAFLEPVLTR